MEMSDIVLKSTSYVLSFLEKIYKDKVTVTGIENIPNNPTLFVANHFTRCETLLLPYFINKKTGKMARSLADSVVFVGAIGDYLDKTGTISTDDPNRNEIILGDLLCGAHNWLIYPEGNMMKNKKVTYEDKKFTLHLSEKTRHLFTGAATAAINTEILREQYFKKPDDKIKEDYLIDPEHDIRNDSTAMVPVNISYYPIRGGENKIKSLAKKFAKKLPSRFEEELEIEGNILGSADIHIHFDKPIFVRDFISGPKALKPVASLIPSELKADTLIKMYRYKLTTAFMRRVYDNVTINLDHIFALTLYYHPEDNIHSHELTARVYKNIKSVQEMGKYRMHPSMQLDVFKVLSGKKLKAWASVMDLAKEQGIIKGGSGVEFLEIDHKALEDEHEFHNIRLNNLLRVHINEMLLLDDVVKTVKKNAKASHEQIGESIFETLYERDVEIFEEEHKKSKGSKHLKPKKIGKPFYLEGKDNKVGIVLSHGYKAAPEEVRKLAEYLNSKGMSVYAVRLDGHGTAPENLKTTKWRKWYDSYMRAVFALEQKCDKVYFVGFSTGGLVSLYAAAKHPSICAGVVCINAAIKLQDIRVRFVKMVNYWNEFTTLFKGKGKKEYVEDEPENPHINYSINYLKGVEELSKLMTATKKELKNIHAPTLIIQSKKDPIVNPKSGSIIFNAIRSKTKEILQPDVEKHVIITGPNNERIFAPINDFIEEMSQ